MTLENMSAIVTGGMSGIGSAIVLNLAEYGADVAVVDKDISKGSELIKNTFSHLGKRVQIFQADTSNFNDSQQIVNDVINEFGRLDILVNNAGINNDSVIWKMTEEQWDSVVAVNMKGYFNFIRNVAPIFKEQLHGKIVNISSINGLRGKFGQANYSASKAGVIALTKSVAKELGRYSINVNAIAPGLIRTEMTDKLPDDAKEAALKEIVLNRMGMPSDVANLVVFLCSELSKHITGEVIKIDGGQYI